MWSYLNGILSYSLGIGQLCLGLNFDKHMLYFGEMYITLHSLQSSNEIGWDTPMYIIGSFMSFVEAEKCRYLFPDESDNKQCAI